MSATEASELITLARDAEALGLRLSQRLAETIALLDCTAHSVRMTQARKRADRDALKRAEQRRKDREQYFMIDDFSVMATRADYADISSDPDFRLWVDVLLQECLSRPLPDQCEIRRDVWLVRVVQVGDRLGDSNVMVGSDCTDSAVPAEIRPLAVKLIRQRALAELQA